ncbi:MAG: Maf family protein, partial [Schwartzia sp.]|nr:Maf family protein [Schwartzia sp. (in: firmicutes)]
ATGEPMDKAGAYAVQGKAAQFIPKIDGSFSNVVGLPLHAVKELSRKAGIIL